MGWLYYRIFARDVNNWYYKLLNELVKPFVSKNGSLIEKFFFFHYGPCPYNLEPGSELKFKEGDIVRYVRFRARVKDENFQQVEQDLLDHIARSQTTIEKEKATFNETADLGNRFGQQRLQLVINYLDSFARMILSLLTDQNQLENTDKPYSTIHLLHNMMGDTINVACANETCREINQVPVFTAFQCKKCGGVTYF